MESQCLWKMAQGKRRVLLITSDHTRLLPSCITMPLLLREIRRGSPECEIKILVATGMHRAMTPEEQMQRFGVDICQHEQIVMHDAAKEEEMADFGPLPSGGRLRLNRLAVWAELIVAKGFIEPHFFAGYSGGQKSILPGIASRETILHNHNAQFIASRQARQGKLSGNPIHRDMAYAAQQAKLAFILNVLMNEEKQIYAAVAGDPIRAHEAGCQLCRAHAGVQRHTADIVITSNGGYPLDQNFYQCVKALSAAEECVREGGCIILCAELSDGHGGDGFYHWFADRMSAAQVMKDIQDVPMERTLADQWQAQILARIICKAHCIVVTGVENRSFIQEMHIDWAENMQNAMMDAEKYVGKNASVLLIPNGVSVIVDEQKAADDRLEAPTTLTVI